MNLETIVEFKNKKVKKDFLNNPRRSLKIKYQTSTEDLRVKLIIDIEGTL